MPTPVKQNAYRLIGRKLIKKWYDLLEGLRGEDNILNMAILLENVPRLL